MCGSGYFLCKAMADNLIFPIQFDLQKAVETAGQEWDKTYAKKLERHLSKRPVNIKLDFESLNDVKTRLAQLKIEPITPETKSSIKELAKELRQLAKALEQVQKYSVARVTASPDAVRASKIALNEEKARSQAALTAQRAARAEANLAQARLRNAKAANVGAAATRDANNAYNEQSGYLQRLLRRMVAYWSVQQVSSFLTNVRQVTAEFELQRVSLGAIIQDQNRANQLFSEIKSFALKSPVSILDLTKYTKQVAAYGFESEKLFDTTKMLADISVGLGVDMSRLTLFLGQVFATGYLRASEVRQATEAGIPLVDKLAKKLEELNGRAYTAAEVMDMISKRAISYELVEQVFKDMTSAGGEFYNMQVKQSQTLFGMWSKLGDAAAIMYDQIGNTTSVNEGMKASIHFLELMMRNWKTTVRVLDSVVVALAVYIVGLKNATLASRAVSIAEAARLAITNRQIIATPKLVASIIGQNAATKLSTVLTKAHTVAMVNQSSAANVLTRAFWKLTATMLANPWIAAAAAIAGVATAILHFTGNAETAAERAEKLNDSVATLKNLEDTTKPLIDTYNELINKTERTAEEQKKLSEVTHELAKQYPGAITAIGNFGAEVELATDKLNQLYQTEKQARMDNTRYELEKTEQKITETEEKIARLQAQLQDGTKTITVGGGISGYTQTITVQMNDEDKGKILKQIDELRYGEDGQGGLLGLQQAADMARRALGLMPSEAAQAVEKFGAWKKTFTTFRQQVGDVRIQLFDDSTIDQFGSLEEALKKTAEEYKKNIALVATYDETLKSAALTSEERAKIETERAEADAMASLAEKALKYYNAMSLLNASTSGRGRATDPRLQILQEMVSTLKQVNKEYDELAKKEGATKALADTQKVYADTFKNMQELAKKHKFALPDFGVPTDTASLTKYLNAIREAMKKLPKSDKAVLALQVDIDKLDIDEQQKKIEAELKRLADRISRTKTAKEFYEKILGQTGDIELATRVSLSIYGSTGEELFEDTVRQIWEVFKSGNKDVEIDLSPVFDITNQRIDYKALADIYDKYQDQIIEKNRNTAEGIVKEGEKTAASNIATWEKELAKAKDYEEQRTGIINRETQRRAEIYKSNLPQEEKDRLAAQSQRKQDEDLAKVNFEEFTKSEDYIKIFENLDNVATSSLKRLRTEMQALIDTNQNLSPENMKTLVKAMEDIDEQISGRGFGNDMIQSVNDYIASIKNLKIAKQELAKAEAEYQAQLPQLDENIALAEAEKVEAQRELNDLKKDEFASENQIVAAELRLNTATANVARAQQAKARAADKVKEAEQKVTGEEDKQKKATTKFVKDLQKVASTADQLAGELGEIKDLLGISEDSAAGLVFDSAISSLQTMSTAINAAATAQAIFNAIAESNPYIAVAAGVLAVGSAITSWITGSKVRKANKEIEKQQKLLDQLEYAYSRLEKAADKTFGSDFVMNQNQQQKILLAQQEAYMKQYEAEKSKGKKADEEKMQEYLDKARDVGDQIVDMQGKIAEKMTGTDVASAARDFANAWLEAYASFGSTSDAIKEKFNDLIKNMIVESVMAKAVQVVLQPIFDKMDEMYKSGRSMTDVLGYAFSQMEGASEAINGGLLVYARQLESLGINIRDMYSTSDNLKGISRDIATASERDINGLASHMSTVEYYVSTVPRIAADVAAMRAALEGGGLRVPNAEVAPAVDYTSMIDIANQHLQSLPRIEQHVSNIYTLLNRVVVAKGGKFGVNSFYNS